MGGPAWKMPMPFTDDGASPAELKLLPDNTPRGWRVDGSLKHELPGTLKDVTVVLVRNQRPVRPSESYIGQLQVDGEYFQKTDWKPGEVLDLDNETRNWYPLWQPGGRGGALLRDLVGQANDDDMNQGWTGGRVRGGTRSGQAAPPPPVSSSAVWQHLQAMSFYGVLEPPDAMSDNRQVLMQRADLHNWDLSRWFNQPCLIVIGQLENAPSPVPMTLNGEPMGTFGRTVVRWVYPLPEAPPRITAN
jgi:hypothetical protein